MSDLKQQSNDLRKQLGVLGKEADDIEKIGGAADEVRQSMKLLEKQIDETARATEKFGDARSHFRSASIGAKALKSDIGAIADTAKKASLAIAGIGTAAAVALSPREELLEFDQTLAGIGAISPEVDTESIKAAGQQMRELSNTYGESANVIAQQHEQLTRSIGFDDAQQTIRTAVEFKTTTGLSITDIEEELGTARISLGIDTPAETREFLELLHGAHQKGIKIDNLDLGDLETFRTRTGEDVFGENFQREFLTTIAFKQVDSFQYADYATAFQEEIERAVLIKPEMDTKAIGKAQDAIKTLAKWGIRAEDGLSGAMQVYRSLGKSEQVQFFTELEPILTAMPAEVIARGSEALPQVQHQVDMILNSDVNMSEAAKNMANTWSRQWQRIGIISQNSLNIVQEQFASVFGVSIVDTAQRLFDFLSSRQDQIRNFFTGFHDGVTPVVSRVWNIIREVYPDVKQFAMDVWTELKRQWDAIAPAAKFVADTIWSIVKSVGGFLRDHPKLVATVLTGVAAWKSYQIVSNIFGTASDAIRGFFSITQGHFHRLNAIVLGNVRAQGALQKTTLSTGQKFLTMGKDMFAARFPKFGAVASGAANIGRSAFAAIPGIVAMGGSLWGALAPVLPVVLPVVAGIGAIAAGGYLIYKHWDGIKSFFVDNFDTIRNVMWFVAPPIAFLMTAGQFIKENWSTITDFFSTLWETVTLAFNTGVEFIKFVMLQGVLAVKNVWDGITGFFKDIWDGVTGIFTNSPLAPIFDFMVGGVKKVVSPLFGFFNNFWDNIFEKGKTVLKWITDKFEWINNFLQGVFGWLRKKNEDAIAELKGQSGDVIKAQVNIDPVENYKDMLGHQVDYATEQVKVLYELTPTQDIKVQAEELSKQLQGSIESLQLESVELASSTDGLDTTEHQEVLQQGISELQKLLQRTDARLQEIHKPTPVNEIRKKTEVVTPVENVAKSDPVVERLKTFEHTEIKQPKAETDPAVENLKTPTPAEIKQPKAEIDLAVETIKTTIPAEIKQPKLELPQTQLPIQDTSNVIRASSVDLENIALGQLAEARKQTEMIKKQTDILRTLVNMTPDLLSKYSDVPNIDLRADTPSVNVAQPEIKNSIATPQVKNDIAVLPPSVTLPTPEKDVLLQQTDLKTATPQKENITPPAIEQVRNPEPTIVNIQAPDPDISDVLRKLGTDASVIHSPVVKNEIAFSPMEQLKAPTQEIVSPQSIVNNQIAVSPAEQIQAPIQEIISPEPIVYIRTENPAINIPQTDVKNEIAPPVVDIPPYNQEIISPKSLTIEQPTPQNEIKQGLQSDFSMPAIDAVQRIEPMPMDNALVNLTQDILGEVRRQTGVLEILKPQEIGDLATGVAPIYDIRVMPELVVDDFVTVPAVNSSQTIENNEQVTHNQTNAPSVENHFHFNVSPQPGQDPEEFARLIAEMVQRQIDESADTFLVT